MRITSQATLDALTRDQKMSASAAHQIKKALEEAENKAKQKSSSASAEKNNRRTASAVTTDKGESKGEAAVRMALLSAFGDWHKGQGEVVQELMPFQTRRFRADFALPRYKVTVEVQGWSHHGRSLSDHHGDRERDMFFAKHNWLAFNISHGQALKQTNELIDAVAHVMTLREAIDRSAVELESVPHKHGIWWRLVNPI